MAHAYTPGLKVVSQTIVEKTRRLPLKGNVLTEVGQSVKAEDVVATTDLPGNIFPINIANLLNIEPADLADFMIKTPGDNLVKGELIAETNGIFGFFKSAVNSPIDGTLESFSKITGQAILREAPIPVSITAYVNGEVSEIIPGEGVSIKTKAAFIQGIFGVGGEQRGPLKMVVSGPNEALEPKHIDDSCKGKIIVGGSYLTYEAFQKAIKTGVIGIVVGGFDYSDIKKIVGYDIGVAITGQEDISTTLVLTEGFSRIHMAEQTFNLLKKHEGDMASLNGATQIRAGVIRPEIIISLSEAEAVNAKNESEIIPMDVGTVIRVIRHPYFGMLGEVTGLPHELQRLESESMARVAKVKIFELDKEVLLPRANLEMIETK